MDKAPEYSRWTKDALIKRIQWLEAQKVSLLQNTSCSSSTQPPQEEATGQQQQQQPTPEGAVAAGEPAKKKKSGKKKVDGKIDPFKYSTRLVAFKLAYLGKAYGGYEFQDSATLSTIEEELWKALVKSCLIFPENPDEVRWEAWDYSKCGRTDRGVSAFGQVVALRDGGGQDESVATEETEEQELPEEEKPFDDHTDEIPYCRILNRLLPADIRVLAWCPNIPAGFSARHECRERQYRYFFTQPAYSPVPHSLENPKTEVPGGVKDGWLDIDAMRAAAKKYEGAHDFRNFCKVDPGKLITNFVRRIFECDVVEVPGAATALPHLARTKKSFPKVYYFHVRGSAFLWHQIRCMVAVLFAVGQGLEPPAVVDELLDPARHPRRPNYTLASEFPLVLWDCVFPDLSITDAPGADPAAPKVDTLYWVYVGEDNPLNKHGVSGLVDQVWQGWRERKMDEILAGQLLSLVTPGGTASGDITRRLARGAPRHISASQRAFEGGDRDRIVGRYVPMLQKDKLPAPEDTYDKEARRKGYKDADDWRAARAKKFEGIPLRFHRPAIVEEGDE
ncbi:tRNA pseudouridine(38/39) synthase [Apiospora phragmitis]|uniref:tRNA pseudouridine(38/39) synthase n=1 Tax=Apiospora phragmitis TaxID=2905665 RepID=A0ABR1WSP5_9PEZI